MATIKWKGDAPAVAQVDSLTVGGTVEATDIFNVTINGKTVSVVAGSTVVNTVAATIQAALAASTIQEFLEITWTNSASAVITATGPSSGKPFTVTVATTETGGGAADSQTFVRAAVTTPSSPNDINVASNWTGGVLPANGDTVIFENSESDALYNLGALSAVTLASLIVKQSFTGAIGLPVINTDNATSYYEYRADYLAISATAWAIGEGTGGGSGRIKINFGSAQFTGNIYNSGQAAEQGLEAILIKGTHASNQLNVNRAQGGVGVAVLSGETSTLDKLRVGYINSPAGDSVVRCGSGVTLTTVSITGGTIELNSACTTITMTDGDLTLVAGAITTINCDGGTIHHHSTGTITTLNVGNGAVVDFSGDMRGVTVTTMNVYTGYNVKDSFRRVTFTNPINFVRCSVADGTLDVGTHITLAVAAGA